MRLLENDSGQNFGFGFRIKIHKTNFRCLREFDARGIAATAMAHLGLSEKEAWQLTMTSYIGAMRAKYPPTEKDAKADPRSDAEVYDSAKAFLARVKAAREGQKHG